MRDVLELGDEIVADVESGEFRLYSQNYSQIALSNVIDEGRDGTNIAL